MQAVLKGDSDTKLEELKKIVTIGEKLGKDVTPDKKKLEILLSRESTSPKESKKEKKEIIDVDNSVDEETMSLTLDEYLPKKNNKEKEVNNSKKTTIVKKSKEDFKPKENKIKAEDKAKSFIDEKNDIRLISTKNDIIKIDFNRKISKDNIKYLTYKFNDNYESIIDISSDYSFANDIKLKLDNIDNMIVLNNKNKTRIKLTNKSKLKLAYALRNKEVIIKVAFVENKKEEKIKQEETIKDSKTEINNKKNSNKKSNTQKQFEPKDIFPAVLSNTKKIIVIDPGHGGQDSGAVGPKGRYEKVVVFEIAKMVYNKLKQNGHKVYLTRNKDKFIKVVNRTVLANDKNADIFISIHCNSIAKSRASEVHGVETYFLSPARSERAKHVAEKENSEDMNGMSDSSKDAFLESLNRPRITASHKLALDVHAGMLQNAKIKYPKTKDAGVKEGPFWVLVGAQMPSILIELGYISHPEESKRLYSKEYQKLLSNGIANGVESYFSKNP